MSNQPILIFFMLFFLNSGKLSCENHSTCQDNLTQKYYCNMSTKYCEHETLSELSKEYIIGLIMVIFISAFANAGGIGGGAVIVPVLTVMFYYEVNEAIPLSKATIFAGAVINVIFLLNQRKENNQNESLIDYKLCSYMLPIMMCGTFFGVYLNFIVPPMIIILLLTGYLLISIFKIYKKYKILSKKEDKRLGTTLSRQMLDRFKSMTGRGQEDESPNQQLDHGERVDTLQFQTKEIGETKTSNETIEVYMSDYRSNTDKNKKLMIQNIKELKSDNSQNVDIGDEFNGSCKDEKLIKISTDDSESSSNLSFKSAVIEFPEQKPFLEMIKDNIQYIMIMTTSILVIITLSLLKEGVFFEDSIKTSRCSILGLVVMIIIALFCMIVSLVAFKFNVKSEKLQLIENCQFMDQIKEETLDQEPNLKTFDECNLQQTVNNKKCDVRLPESLQNRSIFKTDLLEDNSAFFSIMNKLQKKKIALLKLGGVSFFAGIGSGLLGIGGGMIINPFLILLDYSPLDAVAISSMGVLFTSTISTTEFLIMKAIKFSDLNYFLLLAGIGSLSGVFIIKELVHRFQRQSILLLIILGLFLFAVIVLPSFGILSIPLTDYFKFGSVCFD